MHAEPHNPPPDDRQRRRTAWSRQFALAMELPFLVAGTVFIGGLFGYFLDNWLGSKPWMMLLLGGLGLFAGIREMLRRLLKTGPHADGKPK